MRESDYGYDPPDKAEFDEDKERRDSVALDNQWKEDRRMADTKTLEEKEAEALEILHNLVEVGDGPGKAVEGSGRLVSFGENGEKELRSCLVDNCGVAFEFRRKGKVTARFTLSSEATNILMIMAYDQLVSLAEAIKKEEEEVADYDEYGASEEYEEELCSHCNGSGEGMHPGTRCQWCKGSGVEREAEEGPGPDDGPGEE